MPDRDRTAVDVDNVGINAQFPGRGQRHRGERFVDLHHIELVDRDTFAAKSFLDRVGGLRLQRRIRAGHHAMCADLDQPGQSQLGGLVLVHHDDSGRAVRNLRCRSGGDGAVLPERRFQTGQRFGGGIGANALILAEQQGITLALRDAHRHDLVGEDAVLPCRGRLLMRPRRELVLFEPGEFVDVVALLGERAHGLVGEDVVQAVVGHVVPDRHIAVLVAGPAVHQQVRSLGHGLLTTGDHDIELAGPYQLVSEGDRVNAGQAHLVDGERRDIPADACRHRSLPGGHLTGPGGQHLAHDHVLDQRGRDVPLLQRTRDRNGTQITGAEILQRTHQLADGRPCASNDHRCRHDYLQGRG